MAAVSPSTVPSRPTYDSETHPTERPAAWPELQPAKLARGWQAANLAAGLGALAALIVTLGTGLPQLAFLVWMLGGGMLAVMIYRRRQRLAVMSGALGARLGAKAGLMGFVIFALLSVAQMLALRGSGQLQAALEQALKTSAARSGNPDAQQMLRHFLTPDGMRTLIILGVVVMLVLFVAVSAVGGAIAGALSARRETRSL